MSFSQPNQCQNVDIFDIPEILSQIVRYLKKRDIVVCLRVSKDWRNSFIPELWKEVKYYADKNTPDATTISSHARFIKSLAIDGSIPPEILATPFPYLQKLYLSESYVRPCVFSPLLLSNNPTIKEFTMLGYKIPENLKFWELLSNQPNLKYINISFQQVPSNEVHAFWSTLCLLDAAKLDGLILSNNVMDHSTTPIKLKRLILGIVGNPLLHMEVIEKFTGLESLYWSASWFQAKDLINRFINFNWPNLHRIELDFVSFNNVELQQILSTTPRLTALSVDSAKWGFESFNALSCHFETLEKLGARHSKSFTSMMVNTVMCSCPNLKVLKAWKIDGLDIIHNNQMESAGRGNREWVCNQLESVDLRFDLVGLATQIPILEMMARMTKLKILDMTGNLGDKDYVLTISLSLKDGLDVLKPLKYLEHVFITGNSHSMTEDDMEWILQNWKHLTLFEGRFHRDPKRFEELRQMYNMRKSKD